MSHPLLEANNIVKRFGGFVALNDVSLRVMPGERLGLIGPNGSGKTTMINCISGALFNDGGKVVFKGEDISGVPPYRRARMGIARSFQIPKPFRSMSVIENLHIPMEFAAMHRSDYLQEEFEAIEVLESMGLKHKAFANSATLNQVEMRKLELARALAARPDLLVADEAMAGLSTSEVDEILDILFKLNEHGVAVIMIEHVMRAVMRFSQHIVVLDAGKKIAEGKPDEIMSNPLVEKAYLGE
jgi:branched-chain amino acid transport system ATP-binding protein